MTIIDWVRGCAGEPSQEENGYLRKARGLVYCM